MWSQNAFERDNFLPLNEIGLCAHNLLTILGYKVNSIGGDLTCEGTQYDLVLVVQKNVVVYESHDFLGQMPISSSKMLLNIYYFS
jgi:hypothetical protein